MYKKNVLLILFLLSNTICQENNTLQNNKKITNNSFVVSQMNTGLSTEARKTVIMSLRSLLADNYILYTKALNFHWNVEGRWFNQLHAFFKGLYESLQEANDLLAERIRALGGYAPGSLQEFLTLTQLKEQKGEQLADQQMLQIILNDFETVIRALRVATQLSGDTNDWGTNNMLAGLLEKQEKHAWMIRAHLQ